MNPLDLALRDALMYGSGMLKMRGQTVKRIPPEKIFKGMKVKKVTMKPKVKGG